MTEITSDNRPLIRYWEDVQVNDEISGFSMPLDWTSMVKQVNGSQDWNLVHHNPDFAAESGHDGVFYNTGWTAGILGRALSDWAGVHGWVKNLSFQMREMNKNGDTVSVKGMVTEKEDLDADNGIVHIDIWIENDRVGKTTPATAAVSLPKRK